MKFLNKVIENLPNLNNLNIYKRTAARGIIIHGNEILLIYTKRYNDYSFPGGGVDKNEDIKSGLIREIQEETGAQDIKIVKEYGQYEEYRSTYYEGYDILHMISHYYICDASKILGKAKPEDYEIANGSIPIWVDIKKAIEHNNKVISDLEKSMGQSINRETIVLNHILKELI